MECSPHMKLQHCFLPLAKERLRPTRKSLQRLCNNPTYALGPSGSLGLGARGCSGGGMHA